MLISQSLCDNSDFFHVAFRVFPSLHFYLDVFYRLNLEALSHRFSYSIGFIQKRHFVKNGIGILSDFPLKIIYVQGVASEECINLFAPMARKPIIICLPDQKQLFTAQGCVSLSYDEANAVELNACVEKLARSAPDLFTLVRSEPEFVEPLVSVAENPDRFRFGSSRLHPVPLHNGRLFRPNECLANHMRHVLLPEEATTHTAEERTRLLLDSVRLIDEQIAADRLLAARSDNLDGIPEEYVENLDKILLEEDGDSYESLLATVRETGNLRHSRLIFCLPCVNKTIPLARFRRKIPDRVLRLLFEAKDADFNTYLQQNRFRKEGEAEVALALWNYQALEVEYLTNMLTLMSLTERLPVIRCPQLASSFFGKLRELRRRHEEGSVVGLNRSLSQLGKELAQALPKEIANHISASNPSLVRIVSDLPIEWLDIDGVPLMYKCQVSRIPITPGNFLLTHYNQCANDIELNASMARRLLILNCLDKTDNLYQYPKHLNDILSDQNIVHDYAEVASLQEYWKCLDEKRPFILMHFGHGSYDRNADIGYLHIAQERTQVWDFKSGVIPPVVLLGACDTAAIAETHNTPANAFIGLGARAVLGTFLPVRADRTIELYVRIVANLWDALEGEFALETWGQIVWKTIVLNRYLDFLWAFNDEQLRRKKTPAPGETIFEYTYLWKKRLKGGFDTGYKMCTELLKEAISRFDPSIAEDFETFLRRNIVVPHTMFFTQLGSPETIRVTRTLKAPSALKSESHEYWAARGEEDSRASPSSS